MTAKENGQQALSFPKSRTPGTGFSRIIKNIKRDKLLYLLLLPGILYFIIFKYAPMYGLAIAFQKYDVFKGITGSDWVGLKHFKDFINGPFFWRLLRNTLLINIYSLVFFFPAPIILAMALNELEIKSTYRRVAQSISYAPHFISTVVVAGILVRFLSPSTGLINKIRNMIGLESINFLLQAGYFRTIFTSMNLWKEVGFSSIIYLAALTEINRELYEAIDIDGGNKWRKLVHITLPGIAPTIIIMAILRLGNMLDTGFESIILLYNPAIYETADVIDTFVYRSGIEEYNYSFSTGVGMFKSVIGLILVVSANAISRKVTETSLW